MYDDKINFSLWCDFLERNFINNELGELISSGTISGATSNPSIFKEAICDSGAYSGDKKLFKNKDPKTIYEILATSDIKNAAFKFLHNYANNDDGFVSLEVDPNFSNDASNSVKEGKRLFNDIKMPNVMIKVPATNEGFKVMKKLLKRGINVNATLVFSVEQTKKCLKIFKEANQYYQKRWNNSPLPKVVISIFVSRFDKLLDEYLSKVDLPTAKYGIYNATKCYKLIENANLPNVRALFASTGTKSENLPKDYYVSELFYPNAINTAPLPTIKAFIANDNSPKNIPSDEILDDFFKKTEKIGINYDRICKVLLKDGLSAFCKAFNDIMKGLK